MAYVIGCALPIVLAVVSVWELGILGGIVCLALYYGLVVGVLGSVMRKHYDPMAIYDAERRAATRH